jgi:hypothetical protein
MQKLVESWSFKQGDFQSKAERLHENAFKIHGVEKPNKLTECIVSNMDVIKAAQTLKEALSSTDNQDNSQAILLLNKVLESLTANGNNDSFEVWRIPVAHYDIKNLNGRIYPKALFENVRDKQRDAWCGLCGLADHPLKDDDPGLFRDQAVVWHDMDLDDQGTVFGYASFVGPYGHLAQEILNHHGRVGTSSSGFGDVNQITRIVDPNTFQIERLADLVLNPSQGTYGTYTASNHSVAPTNFMKDMSQPAVINYKGIGPINESDQTEKPTSITETTAGMKGPVDDGNPVVIKSTPVNAQSKIIQNNTNNGENMKADSTNIAQPTTQVVHESKKLTKAEEKIFRNYVTNFLAESTDGINPIDRLNECTDILECFEDGNCADLKEKVEEQILAEKNRLEKMVESAVALQKDYEMTPTEFREAAEKNVEAALLLKEQVVDYKELVEEAAIRNGRLNEEIESLKKQLAEAQSLADAKIKNYNKELVASLKESDKSTEEVELLKEANKVLENRLATIRSSIKENAKSENFKEKYSELKNSYDNLVRENEILNKRRENIKKSSEEKITESTKYVKTLETQNKSLKEALDNFGEELTKITETLDVKDSEISALKETLKETKACAKDTVSKLSETNDRLEKDNGLLESKLKEAVGIITKAKEEAEKNAKTISTLTTENTTLKESIKTATASVETLKNNFNEQTKKYNALKESFDQYKDQVSDVLDTTKHLMPTAANRINIVRENVEVNEYWEAQHAKYGKNIEPFEKQIHGAKNLKEATSAFLRHRNQIIPGFDEAAPITGTFMNESARQDYYEAVGRNDFEGERITESEASTRFVNNLHAQGLY